MIFNLRWCLVFRVKEPFKCWDCIISGVFAVATWWMHTISRWWLWTSGVSRRSVSEIVSKHPRVVIILFTAVISYAGAKMSVNRLKSSPGGEPIVSVAWLQDFAVDTNKTGGTRTSLINASVSRDVGVFRWGSRGEKAYCAWRRQNQSRQLKRGGCSGAQPFLAFNRLHTSSPIHSSERGLATVQRFNNNTWAVNWLYECEAISPLSYAPVQKFITIVPAERLLGVLVFFCTFFCFSSNWFVYRSRVKQLLFKFCMYSTPTHNTNITKEKTIEFHLKMAYKKGILYNS